MTNAKRTRHNNCSRNTFRVPTCCGMEMAYSGQIGFYCLKCRNEAGFDALK